MINLFNETERFQKLFEKSIETIECLDNFTEEQKNIYRLQGWMQRASIAALDEMKPMPDIEIYVLGYNLGRSHERDKSYSDGYSDGLREGLKKDKNDEKN